MWRISLLSARELLKMDSAPWIKQANNALRHETVHALRKAPVNKSQYNVLVHMPPRTWKAAHFIKQVATPTTPTDAFTNT